MKSRIGRSALLLLFLVLSSGPAEAQNNYQNNYIVRDDLGSTALHFVCYLLRCSVIEGIDGSLGNVFLISNLGFVNETQFLFALLSQPGIVDVEPDLTLHLTSQNLTAPSGLWDTTPVNYFGTSAWDGYVNQPAGQIIRLQRAQSTFNATGTGIVAIIDTGVDLTHPVLQRVLVKGYDFTRNQEGGSEMADVNQSSMAVVNGAYPAQVNQSSMAVINQDGQYEFSQPQYAAFGHGTMVAGIVHLVAPTTQIMSLKAFKADGTGTLSDVLRAIYYAAQHDAKVVNMSFDFSMYSLELSFATHYATLKGLICVASVGNDGERTMVYPAGLRDVMGVASTTNDDTLSSFSNYGHPPVWVGAPGEGVITIYPFGSYAAGWGTSFSAPFVSGTAALLVSVSPNLRQSEAAQAISNAHYVSPALGYGRLDVYRAIRSLQ
jgi:subtilisin family serine protease